MNASVSEIDDRGTSLYVRRHVLFGWWSLLLFLTLGIVLDALHGFKVAQYVDTSSEIRRLMWTLAHAHGVLLSLVQVVFGLTVKVLADPTSRWPRLASPWLIASNVLLPGGFFLGGTYIYDGDPGMGVLLVPVGAIFLFIAVFVTARGAGASTQ